MTWRLAHLSDIHFGGENASALAAAGQALVCDPVDLIVVTGDITVAGAWPEFRAASAWAAVLPAPVLMTPGNHDTPLLGLVERLVAPFGRYQDSLGEHVRETWADAFASVAAVNTARGVQLRANWSKGAVSRRQADQALVALAPRPAGALGVVACHHPLVEMIGGPMTGLVHGGEAAARRLCEARVDLVLTGHIHAPFAMALPYGDGHTYAVGASTLSLRERGAPAGFNLIDVETGDVTVRAQGWTGSHYETWRTWSLPRRPLSA